MRKRLAAIAALVAAVWLAVAVAPAAIAQGNNADRPGMAVDDTGFRANGRVQDRETRFALVIGNSAYSQGRLATPRNDAQAIIKSLTEAGFTVKAVLDAGREAMRQEIARFSQDLRTPDSVGLFYFAGIGVQVEGENYLLPVDMPVIKNASEARLFAVEFSDVLAGMQRGKAALNIAILDASRDSPLAFSGRSLQRGLAPMVAPANTLVAFSTAPGQSALDGNEVTTPYSAALAAEILTSGIPLEEVFRRTRRKVIQGTNGAQIPWESSSVTVDFFFKPKVAEQTSQIAADEAAWKKAQASRSQADVQAYLRDFPQGRFAAEARQLLAQLAPPAAAGDIAQKAPEPAAEPKPAVAATAAATPQPQSLAARDVVRHLPLWSAAALPIALLLLRFSGPGLAGLVLVAGLPLVAGFTVRSAVSSSSTVLASHGAAIQHLEVSKDGRYVASADVLGRVWVREADTGATVLSREPPKSGARIHAIGFGPPAAVANADGAAAREQAFVIVSENIETWQLAGLDARRAREDALPQGRPVALAVVLADGSVWGTSCAPDGCLIFTKKGDMPVEKSSAPAAQFATAAVRGLGGDVWLVSKSGNVAAIRGDTLLAQPWFGPVSGFAVGGDGSLWTIGSAGLQHVSSSQAVACADCETIAAANDAPLAIAGSRASGATVAWHRDGASSMAGQTLAHPGPVTAVAAAAGVAVTGGADGMVRIWDAATGREFAFARGHKGEISHAHITAGNRVVTAAVDGSVMITDVAGARALSMVDPPKLAMDGLSWGRRQFPFAGR
jgi:uncharacterized caspase-like protein/WD40 repeat protein